MSRVPSFKRYLAMSALALALSAAAVMWPGAALADSTPGPITGLTSATHSDESAWYSSGGPSFAWDPVSATDSAIAGYSIVLDQNAATVPDTTSDRQSLSFLARVPFAVGSSPAEVRVGDVNGDGKQDIVAENYGSSTVSVLLGAGDGTFAATVDYPTGAGPWSLALVDANGDGTLDIVTGNLSASTASVLLGAGDGTFGAKADFPTGSAPECMRVGDVDDDDRPDIVTTNSTANTVSVLLGNGDGTFRTRTDFATSGHPTSIDLGDLNGDGSVDLVTANTTPNTVSVLMGNGDGSFQPKVDYGTGSLPYTVIVKDVDRNGTLDVETVNYGASSASILLNNGDGTFRAKVDYPTGSGPYALDVADLNHDGAPDLVTSNHNGNSVSILFGNGDGTFTAKTDRATGAGPFWVGLGDFNDDGYGDLVSTDYPSGTVSVHMSQAFLAAFYTGKADGVWYFHVRAVDSRGTGGPTASRIVRIDTTDPSTLATGLVADDHSGYTRGPQTLTLGGGDASSGVAATYYTIDGGDRQTYGEPFSVSAQGSHTILFWSVDAAGNEEPSQAGYVNIDALAPSTTAPVLAADDHSNFTHDPWTVTLTAEDTQSGVAATYYTIDGGDRQTYGDPFTVSEVGVHPVTYWSVDGVGNVEAVHTGYVNIASLDALVTVARGLSNDPQAGWVSTPPAVSLSASGGGGRITTHYTVDNGAPQTYAAQFIVTGDGSHTVTYWSTDAAGNVEHMNTGHVNIDTTAPSTQVLGHTGNGWSRTDVVITLGAGDSLSGLSVLEYRLGSGGWMPYAAPIVVSAEGETVVSYRATDNAGNIGPVGETVARVDKTGPRTAALAKMSVRKGKKATFRLRVTDRTPTAKVTIRIYRGRKLVKRLALGTRATNTAITYRWQKCTLETGRYTWRVSAVDEAGNAQVKIGSARLRVK
jgi:hypothetical protein